MTALANPYSDMISGPVSGENDFFGRDRLLDDADSLLCQPGQKAGNLAICGPRKIGKTSLLQRIQRLLELRRPEAVAVSWSGEQCLSVSASGFVHGLYHRLRRALEKHLDLQAEPLLPTHPQDQLFVQMAFERLLELAGSRDLHVIFFLDEFQVFVHKYQLGFEHYNWLRSLTQASSRQWSAALVIATLQPLQHYSSAINSSGLLATFKPGVPPLGPLDRRSALALVETPAQRVGFDLPGGAAETMYAQMGGHPYLTALSAHELFQRSQRGPVPKLHDAEWLKETMKWATPVLEQIAKGIPEELHEEVTRLVSSSFARPFQSLTPTAEALVHCGLCVWQDELHLHPAGAVFARYLRDRFDSSSRADELADPSQVRELRDMLQAQEPRLRNHVEAMMRKAHGSHWEKTSGALTLEQVGKARNKSSTGRCVDGLTVGELSEVLKKVPGVDPTLKGIVDKLSPVLKIRNKNEHGSLTEAIESLAVQEALLVLNRLRTYLDNHGIW